MSCSCNPSGLPLLFAHNSPIIDIDLCATVPFACGARLSVLRLLSHLSIKYRLLDNNIYLGRINFMARNLGVCIENWSSLFCYFSFSFLLRALPLFFAFACRIFRLINSDDCDHCRQMKWIIIDLCNVAQRAENRSESNADCCFHSQR